MNSADAELLANLPEDLHEANDVPTPTEARAKERAARSVLELVEKELPGARLRVSPLGPAWSRDLDLYVDAPPSPEKLKALGWVPLLSRWAIVDEGRVLAGVDMHEANEPMKDDAAAIVARSQRRGRVTLREVLELRALRRSGSSLEELGPVLRAAARVEAALGGDELAQWLDGPAQMPPIDLDRKFDARLRSRVGLTLKPPVIIAVSGVDGAGKSTLAETLLTDLRSAGLEAQRVWARPGMEMRLVKSLAKVLKRTLGKGSDSAVRKVARGETTSANKPSSRKGIVGWVWALLVTLSYISKVRSAQLRGRGILVFDRHLLDALVTLDFVYAGVNLRLQRFLIRRLIPRAAVTLYLSIDPDVAVARKKSVVFGEFAIRSQVEHYRRLRSEIPDLMELDASQPAEILSAEALRAVAVQLSNSKA